MQFLSKEFSFLCIIIDIMLIFVKMSQHYASNYFPFEFFIAGDENDMKLEQRIEMQGGYQNLSDI